jgi:hypothetical protein
MKALKDYPNNPTEIQKVLVSLAKRGAQEPSEVDALRDKVASGAYGTLPEGRTSPDVRSEDEENYWKDFLAVPAGNDNELIRLRQRYPKWREYQAKK